MTVLVAGWLARVPPPGDAPGSERGEEFGKTSPIALVVILLLGLATALLIRSMNRRLRNVPASFDPPESTDSVTDADSGDEPTDTPTTGRTGPDPTEGPPRTGSP